MVCGMTRIVEAIIAIDPGARTGWAVFRGGLLSAAGVMSPGGRVRTNDAEVVFVEVPDRVEPGIPLLDILLCARRAGELGERHGGDATVEYVNASAWKGSVPKKIHNSRVLALLSASERAILSSKDHNMIDAVGLGLWALGRMGRGK